jgi:uncharacterized membrane protein
MRPALAVLLLLGAALGAPQSPPAAGPMCRVEPMPRDRLPVVHAVLWDGGRARNLGAPGCARSTAIAINDAGQVVGSSALSPWNSVGEQERRCFLWDAAHGMRDLQGLLARESGWRAVIASSIDRRGAIAATGGPARNGGPFYGDWRAAALVPDGP